MSENYFELKLNSKVSFKSEKSKWNNEYISINEFWAVGSRKDGKNESGLSIKER